MHSGHSYCRSGDFSHPILESIKRSTDCHCIDQSLVYAQQDSWLARFGRPFCFSPTSSLLGLHFESATCTLYTCHFIVLSLAYAQQDSQLACFGRPFLFFQRRLCSGLHFENQPRRMCGLNAVRNKLSLISELWHLPPPSQPAAFKSQRRTCCQLFLKLLPEQQGRQSAPPRTWQSSERRQSPRAFGTWTGWQPENIQIIYMPFLLFNIRFPVPPFL